MEALAHQGGAGGVSPRIVVVRSFTDVKAAAAMLTAGIAVLFVLRGDQTERRRTLDLLAGWSLGSGGSLDRISPNTIAASPPGGPAVRLGRSGVVPALQEVFDDAADDVLTRDEEDGLIAEAAAGSVEARRRLTDAYAELATLLALWLRPPWLAPATAVSLAQEELDSLVSWPPRDGVLLTSLVDRINTRVTR